jgi:sulfur-carrier protein adenylyltransferase/sulfurtransferase
MDNKEAYRSSHSKLPFIGIKGQELLEQKKVLVIGAGGLGCPCLQSIAGAGVGTIGIADFDTVAVSNLHRQHLYQYPDVGKFKTTVAAERLTLYNPFINIQTHQLLVDEMNAPELISSYDVIVDGTDNFTSRYVINDACVYLNKPLVYGAIYQAEGHVTVFNYNGSPTLRCLFPKDENETVASCAEIGAYNIITGIIGIMMANEVIKIMVQHPDVLAGKLIQLDVLTGKTLPIRYQLVDENKIKSVERFTKACHSKTISPQTLREKINRRHAFHLIDVREPDEHSHFNIGGSNIPLQSFLQLITFNFSPEDEVIIYCQKGIRSKQAVEWLGSLGFQNPVSLYGGIDLYKNITDTNY